jgi:3-hydroxyacyl-CoA dehydrogenase
MSEPKPAVRLEREEDTGVITVDYPPVNALGPGVPEGIIVAINQANTDPTIRAMVLMGAGRSFIAGADIKQFGKPRVSLPLGQRVYDILDASEKPVVAAIHGHALGGGFEIALACHYRIAVPTAKVGLPEVLLGILPGGGGTQRLPRVVGCKLALEMITTGRHVGAPEAARLGILDAVLPDGAELRTEAVAFARSIAERRPLPRARDWDMPVAEPGLFEATRQAIARRSRNQTAPYHCIAAVEAACTLPFDEGIKRERELFNELENSAEARALRYAFFAEREVVKLPNVPDSVRPRELRSVALIGAGTMGGGIAMAFADHGYFVRIIDKTPEALARGMERVRANYAMSVRRGSLAREEMEWRLARIAPVHDYQDISECDVAIEAVSDEGDVKRAVFRQLDAVMKRGALLLSNTSGPDIDELAAETRRPGDVAGAYFFSPANVMKLLEVVRGKASSPETLVTAMHMGRRVGKIAVLAGNTDGFVANRSRTPLITESVILLEEGCLPEQVDRVMVEFGYPMGPFAVSDLAGLDIGAAARRRRATLDPNYRALSIADRLVALGRYGQKTGAGWYRYEKGDRTPRPDPEVARIIREMAKEHRAFGDQEILHRLLFASVNEACRILEEGQAFRASDVDVMWLHGFGFPRYRGGLMFWADGIGAPAIYQQVSAWHQQFGDRWVPSRLLRDVAERGGWLRELRGVTT